jgi:hypothetical protein
MIIQVITKDGRIYRISNIKEDHGCPYTAGEFHLNIFLTNPCNIYYHYNGDELSFPHFDNDKVLFLFLANPQNYLFNYQNDAVIVPYNNIISVIFRDKIGEDLSRFIYAKNHNGQEPPDPPFYPAHPSEPDLIGLRRDERVLGHMAFSEGLFSLTLS